MFDIRTVQLDAVSYLHMMLKKSLSMSKSIRSTYTLRLALSLDIILLLWSQPMAEYVSGSGLLNYFR